MTCTLLRNYVHDQHCQAPLTNPSTQRTPLPSRLHMTSSINQENTATDVITTDTQEVAIETGCEIITMVGVAAVLQPHFTSITSCIACSSSESGWRWVGLKVIYSDRMMMMPV